ncbi:MAG TPA: 4-alpha-glucanotransferase, partial [Xanthomonadales bacterium]|nr:4-alpha-glucanotransferase [Xanthomonadales bacterium]
MVLSSKKIIGTLVPLSALSSLHSKKEDQDTFETGMAFLDWLHRTGQTAWQMLPLHQTQLEKDSAIKRVPSPYKGYGIGLDPKYLSSVNPKLEYRNSKQIQKTNDINIKRFENFDFEISKIASNFEFRASDLEKFIHENKDWIYDYALFCALTDHFGTDDWRRWETDLRDREKAALNKFSKLFRREIDQHVLLQYQLHKEYEKLRDKAKKLNIKLIGDLPYYLSINSPLVWAHQNIFQLKRGGEMEFVSGLPDGPAAHFGRQVWGHPLYKWGG